MTRRPLPALNRRPGPSAPSAQSADGTDGTDGTAAAEATEAAAATDATERGRAGRAVPGAAAILVAAALAVAGAVAVGTPLPTPVRGGQTIQAEISPSGEGDDYEIYLFAGDRLQVKVAERGPVRGLESTLALTAPVEPAGLPVVKGNGTRRASLTFTAETEGAHRVRVTGGTGEFTGATGNYSAAFTVKRAKVPKQTPDTAAGGPFTVSFPATADAAVTITAATKRGGFDLTALRGPGGDDETGFAAALRPAANRRKATVKKLALTGGNGVYELGGTADAGSAVVVTVTVAHAERRATRVLGGEPDFDAILPPFPDRGVVGTMLHVAGTNFTYQPVPGGEDVYPRFFVGSVEVPRAAIERPNGFLYRFPVPEGLAPGVDHDLTVVNADGQGAVAPAAFRIVPPPAPTSISATEAGPAGGRALRISGSDFRSGTLLFFGTTIAQPSVVLSDRIDVIAPAHAPGTVTIRLLDEFGQGADVPQPFTYLDIGSNSVTSVDRTFLHGLGGETVTVTGDDFGATSVLTLDGVDTGASLLSAAQMQFTTAPHAHGTASLRVTDQYGQTSAISVSVRGFVDETDTRMPAPVATTNSLDGFRATRVLAGDLDGDDLPDLVLLQRAAAFGSTAQRSRVRVLMQEAQGTYTDATSSAIPAVSGDEDWRARDGVLTDLDGDLDLDLAIVTDESVSSGARSSLRLLRNDGSGVFTDRTSAWAPALTTYGDTNQGVAIVAGNFDGQTGTDLAILHNDYFTEQIQTVISPGDDTVFPPIPPVIQTTYNYYPGLRVLRNDGAGGLARMANAIPAVASTDAQQWQGDALAAADVDGANADDLFVTRDAAIEFPSGTWLRSAFLLRNNGSGTFSDVSSSALPSASDPEYLQADRAYLLDADDDGDRDVFLVSNGPLVSPSTGTAATTPALRVLLNSAGTFTAAGSSVLPANSGNDVLQADGLAVGDLDGDGHSDLVVVRAAAPTAGGRAARVLRRSGSAWIDASVALPHPVTVDDGHGSDVVLLDLVDDGDLEVIVVRNDADETARNTRLLANPLE